MKAVLSWLGRTSLLYVLLVLAIGVAVVLAPALSGSWRAETAGIGEVRAEVAEMRSEADERLKEAVTAARTMPLEQIESRIAERERERAQLENVIAAQESTFLSSYRPSRILARKRAELSLAVVERELQALEAARSPRRTLASAGGYLERNPLVPSRSAIAAASRQCQRARAALGTFRDRYPIEQQVREFVRSERSELIREAREDCGRVESLRERRERGLAAARQVREARETLATLKAEPIPEEYADDVPETLLRDILWQALIALLAIVLLPFFWRTVAYHLLAPIAESRPPLRFVDEGKSSPHPFPPAQESRVSLMLRLAPGEEALVRQGFLQSSSLSGEKRTRWLLDWANPLTSLASGLRFLTAIRGAGEQVSVSAVSDPLAELAEFEIPAAAAAIVRPSALAAVIQNDSTPLRITSHWRLFSLPAWLTMQLRYLAFHGPVRLVLKGGRGVRIEPADRGRIVGQKQLIGLSSGSAYSVVRTETFWPYFFGREPLLKDRIESGDGVVLIEEAPLAGRSGIGRGLAGGLDALLKVFGI